MTNLPDREIFSNFEDLGEEAVRLQVQTTGFPLQTQRAAILWLAQKERDRLKKAKTRDSIAEIAAIIAAITGTLSALISALSWLYPRHR